MICQALVGLHAFTGCDSVSWFAGVGKAKPFNLFRKHADFVDIFTLGREWRVSDELAGLEKFCCSLYGRDENSINNMRSKIYCAKRGKV